MKKINKILRFISIYGWKRTLVKALGRSSLPFPIFIYLLPKKRNIGLIGCGQFGFATISYFLGKNLGNKFHSCYDIDPKKALKTKKRYKYQKDTTHHHEIISNSDIDTVYIASNHASHTDYAVEAMQADKVVYVEKPISVTPKQLKKLINVYHKTNAKLYVGYNRPFSSAVRSIRPYLQNTKKAITLTCTIAGHILDEDHWYRKPDEGTRICGNVGHWLDLSINLLFARSLPQELSITLTPSNKDEVDENVNITMTSDLGDLIVITLTARAEPFEGIHESIMLQHDTLMARIDDFRKMHLWNQNKYNEYTYFPKDVGHERAILQPFNKEPQEQRDINEVFLSSALMLFITDMVRSKEKYGVFKINDAIKTFNILKS